MKRPSVASNQEYLSQWDFEKNQLDPHVLTQGSSKKAWWICPAGHSYDKMALSPAYELGHNNCTCDSAVVLDRT